MKTIKVYKDVYAENPREAWDNMGTIVDAHRNYYFDGKSLPYNARDIDDAFDMYLDEIGLSRDDVIYLPVYLYDHSGITVSTEPFSCPWDSGQLGFIYVSRKDARDWMAWSRLSDERVSEVEELLRSEIQILDYYLTGETYGFRISDGYEELDAWGGYYGPIETNGMLDDIPEDLRKQALNSKIVCYEN